MNKKEIQKIVDFYNKDDIIIMYILSTDDFQGFIEVDIQENKNGEDSIFISRSSHPRTQEYNYLKDCNINDFRFYKRIDIFK